MVHDFTDNINSLELENISKVDVVVHLAQSQNLEIFLKLQMIFFLLMLLVLKDFWNTHGCHQYLILFMPQLEECI